MLVLGGELYVKRGGGGHNLEAGNGPGKVLASHVEQGGGGHGNCEGL